MSSGALLTCRGIIDGEQGHVVGPAEGEALKQRAGR